MTLATEVFKFGFDLRGAQVSHSQDFIFFVADE
jgi:hypothetical protein